MQRSENAKFSGKSRIKICCPDRILRMTINTWLLIIGSIILLITMIRLNVKIKRGIKNTLKSNRAMRIEPRDRTDEFGGTVKWVIDDRKDGKINS